MTRVFVTGGTGFVGRALVPSLLRDGHAVTLATRSTRSGTDAVDGARTVDADLAAPIDWAPLLEGIEVVVHLAGLAHATRAIPASAYDQINRLATQQLASAAARAGARRFVFVSSIRAQTGPVATGVLRETDAPRPSDPYGRSKLEAEVCVRDAGIAHTIFRPVLMYGPRLKGNLRSLDRLARLPVPLPFGAFANRRSLLSLDAMIRAIAWAVDDTGSRSDTYIVADRHPIALRDIIAALRAGRARRPGLVAVPPALFRTVLTALGRSEAWDRLGGELVVDPSRLIATDWRPVDDTRAELARVVD